MLVHMDPKTASSIINDVIERKLQYAAARTNVVVNDRTPLSLLDIRYLGNFLAGIEVALTVKFSNEDYEVRPWLRSHRFWDLMGDRKACVGKLKRLFHEAYEDRTYARGASRFLKPGRSSERNPR